MPTTALSDAGRHRALAGSLRRFGYLYFVLILVLPIIVGFVFWPAIDLWWTKQAEAPQLQQAFGFTLEERPRAVGGGVPGVRLVITKVVPGGVFDQLGVRPGDVITCLQHGEAQFWGALMAAREGYRASISVVPAERLADGCDARRRLEVPGQKPL